MSDEAQKLCLHSSSDTCGDSMLIVQTSFRPTYRGGASDGRA